MLVSVRLSYCACFTARTKGQAGSSSAPMEPRGRPLMALSLCNILAVQQPPLLSRTHHLHITHSHWAQQLSSFCPSWSQYRGEFKRHN